MLFNFLELLDVLDAENTDYNGGFLPLILAILGKFWSLLISDF